MSANEPNNLSSSSNKHTKGSCGVCGGEGHNRRTCHSVNATLPGNTRISRLPTTNHQNEHHQEATGHQQWLKLFFYLLDVGTSNALILYKLSKGGSNNDMLIVDFKESLMKSFVGPQIEAIQVDPNGMIPHLPEKAMGRNRCAHCAIFGKSHHTRFCCAAPDCLC